MSKYGYLKQFLIPVFLGVSVSSISVAYASQDSTFYTSGFYAGIQAGHSKISEEISNFPLNLPASTYKTATIPADPDHNYNITIDKDTFSTITKQTLSNTGIGGRIYAGYQFMPYFALETGYTRYAKASFQANSEYTEDLDAAINFVDHPDTYLYPSLTQTWARQYNGEVTQSALDLVGKLTLPFKDTGFGVYAKAGVAYVTAKKQLYGHLNSHTTVDDDGGSNIDTSTDNQDTPNGYGQKSFSKTYQAIRPVAGLGVNYAIPNSNFSIDASYTRVFGNNAIANADLMALGLEYKFG